MLFQLKLHLVNFFKLVEEPWVDGSHLGDLLDRMALANCVLHVRETVGMRRDEALRENFWFDFSGADSLARIKRADSLLQRFLEGAANGHYFADGFHLRTERFVGAGKFFELPLGN